MQRSGELNDEDKSIAMYLIDLILAKEELKQVVKDIHTYHK
jgi:hypothetical protein